MGIDNISARYTGVPGPSPLASMALAVLMMLGLVGWRRWQRVPVRSV